ncbi:tetratricopeptide repeat protein [Kineococcus xinjiangensis]|uniref:Tetratricopeptide repeat protein n=1 Tax=Kineococcus xinjiangensis TaxID=512762 RepID=A0A2S6ICF1_9ACTN|nr:tetratricopeptide repeat protein [Kineococcus xinjiangensis]PPK90870.1 tetratricopeptide repeat protein [Kineococcus xinjiangensis]
MSDGGADGAGAGLPSGSAYDWMQRGTELLKRGDAAAAVTLLRHAHSAEPASAAVLELLARAQYDSGDFAGAVDSFGSLVRRRPDADYAHFGLGLSLSRLGRFALAVEHLAMAHAMAPQRAEYADRLRQVRATLAARQTPGSS